MAAAVAAAEVLAGVFAYPDLPVQDPWRLILVYFTAYAAAAGLAGGAVARLLLLPLRRRPRLAVALGVGATWLAIAAWRGMLVARVLNSGPAESKDVAHLPLWPILAGAVTAGLLLGGLAFALGGSPLGRRRGALAAIAWFGLGAGILFVTRPSPPAAVSQAQGSAPALASPRSEAAGDRTAEKFAAPLPPAAMPAAAKPAAAKAEPASEAASAPAVTAGKQEGSDSRFASPSPSSTSELSASASGSSLPPAPLLDPVRTNLLLIVVDTLRADHTSAYSYARDTSPNIAALARQGVLFERCVTQRTNTTASMATLMTGLYPPTHRVLNNGDVLQDFNQTLAEMLAEQGRTTVGIVTTPAVGGRLGFGQGFRQFAKLAHRIPEDELEESRLVNRAALGWLEKHGGEPFFLWLHYKDPHSPYTVPEEYQRRYLDDGSAASGRAPAAGPQEGGPTSKSAEFLAPSAEEVAWFTAQYDAEIAFFDESLGQLLDALDRWGLRENTLVVLTADHGEGLGEHDERFAHGGRCYETTAHVPLILAHSALPAGRRVASTVSLVDLVPTIRELLGMGSDAQLEGQSLVPLIRSPAALPARRVHFTIGRFLPGYQTHAVTSDRHKLIFTARQGRAWTDQAVEALAKYWLGGAPFDPYRCRVIDRELFDLEADRAESRNLAGQGLPEEGELAASLWSWMDAAYGGGPARGVERAPLTPELREQLRGLGYVK